MALKCHIPPARLVVRSRDARRLGVHIREFGLVGLQDRLAVEPACDPGPCALDLDRVPLGSRPRWVGGRALVPMFVSIVEFGEGT
jgi:hypothetical protein